MGNRAIEQARPTTAPGHPGKRDVGWRPISDSAGARTLADAALADVDAHERGDALLVVSELVDNAREHGAAPVGARIWRVAAGRRLRVEVRDASTELPEPHNPRPTDVRGRGLLLVEALASYWGVLSGGRGKIVWAEIPV
ncbi:MAG TPA: ATP-binding protein [Pseudonocardiaceae bacterium]|jgi:anti-sigma regulatory factor (Ser/Thr protein kinase)|nr:ATP-binding protein [Pseudonocardiaceae bacterium]